jgi:DNA-binding transcriptional regulator YiaG
MLVRLCAAVTPDDLRAIRSGLGLSQTSMARACGVSQPHYAAWETGGKRMSRIAQRLVDILAQSPRLARRYAHEPLTPLGDSAE